MKSRAKGRVFKFHHYVFSVIGVIYLIYFTKFRVHELFFYEPLHMLLGLDILLVLYYLSHPYVYLKWHLPIIFFPLRAIPYFRRAFALTEDDKELLSHFVISVNITRKGRVVPTLHECVVIFLTAAVVYVQLFVWFRAILYHLFGWKIFPHVLNIPALIPWG